MATKTTQPVKGVLRTALALVIGIGAAAGIVPAIGEAFPDLPHVKVIVGIAGIVATGATAFFGSPVGNWLLSFVSLDRTTVDKANTLAATTAAEAIPTAKVVVPEVAKVIDDVKAVASSPSAVTVSTVATDVANTIADAAPTFDQIVSGLKPETPAAPAEPVPAPSDPVAESEPAPAVPFTGGAPDPGAATVTTGTPAA